MAALGDNIAEVPNEPLISQRSFRQIFEKKACVATITDAYKRMDSGDIEG